MKRAILILFSSPFLCSCGVYQAFKYDEETQGYSGFAVVNPVTAIIGMHPDTKAENFKPLSYYAYLISTRNDEEMTPARAKDILTAMDRCFGDKDVKKMSEQKAESLFGPPDERKIKSGWTVLIYRIQGGKYGERWLTLG